MDAGGLELWGGIECTVARIRDRIVDQTHRTGHHRRIDDLDAVAALGIKTLRYPALWERVAPEGLERADWSWTDERLERLRALGIEPIVTLLHHGSGPFDTDLLDPQFPRKLACFARAVAQRYPWLRKFTPVNEPLTTARFSALYGHWYPHARDGCAFGHALINEVQGIARAMEAIREVIPDAQLVQTEDLGKTYSTRELAYQAHHENERRWASLDLLCGQFHRNIETRDFFRRCGVDVSDAVLQRCVCPPDILGFNYYVTGERFLDHRVNRYPGAAVGGNGRHAYIDLEAVRTYDAEPGGITLLGREAWERFGRPIAITEAHLAASEEEQICWLEDLYMQTLALRDGGVDVKAFTVWALFGAFDWNSLLTAHSDYYENGCFDVSDGVARPTLIAQWVAARARGERLDHPALACGGWWRRDDRFIAVDDELAS